MILVLCAIINKFRELSKEENDEEALKKADKLEKNFIISTGWRDTDNELIKLKFDNLDTNKFFINYIVKSNDNYKFDITDNEKSLKKNYELIQELLDNYFEMKNMDSEDLSIFVEDMMDRMYVILLKTESEEIANQMFETLNNTGKKLSNFYVVKNKCVKILGQDKTAEYWDNIEVTLDGLNKNNFLSQFVSMFNGKTGTDGALSILEDTFLVDEEGTERILKDMLQISQHFLETEQPGRITNPEEDINKKRYIELLKTLKSFKAKQFRPLLFSMIYKDYDLIFINKVLKQVLNLQVRNFFIVGNNPNTVEQLYPDLAKKVYYSENIITDDIIFHLKQKTISDEKLKESLRLRVFDKPSDNKLLRIILKELYDNESQKEIRVNSNSIEVNLEHILPQKPKKNSKWVKDFTKEERERYTYLIGNMTLILGSKNSSLGNKDFEKKKNKLFESEIPQNKDLSRYDSWTKEVILERTDNLANQMIKIY